MMNGILLSDHITVLGPKMESMRDFVGYKQGNKIYCRSEDLPVLGDVISVEGDSTYYVLSFQRLALPGSVYFEIGVRR